MLTNISEIRGEFPILTKLIYSKPLVYFDNAATSQRPKAVINTVNLMNSSINGNIHRAPHKLSNDATALYEEARDKIQSFINAKHREEVVFTSGTTASINIIAGSFSKSMLKKGDTVILSELEHHSNIVPWQFVRDEYGINIKVIPTDESGRLLTDRLSDLIDSTVKLVSVTHISNVTGLINPIEKIIEISHNKGVKVLIDGAQGIVHSKVDVQKLDCDFYVFSGHKIFGPTGIGIMYGKYDLLEQMQPWMGGGDMIESVTFEKTTYAPLPLKFEAGTSNYVAAAGLGSAVDFILSIDPNFVNKHEESIVEYMYKELKQINNLTLYGDDSFNRIPLFSFNIKGLHPSDIATLMDKTGVALRSGSLCAEPLMRRLNINGVVRASLLIYNTIDEAEYFIDSLKRVINILSK